MAGHSIAIQGERRLVRLLLKLCRVLDQEFDHPSVESMRVLGDGPQTAALKYNEALDLGQY
jgi:hypothetical protein